ncbi:response regulator [Salegentibacter sp. HM20]
MLEVLIIDDDQVVVFIQKKMVSHAGLSSNPKSFFEAEAALCYLQKRATENDTHFLIMLDINMPKMNGWEFLEKLQKSAVSDRALVVMVTSSVDARDRQRAQEYKNVIDFIEKPITAKSCERLAKLPGIKNLIAQH